MNIFLRLPEPGDLDFFCELELDPDNQQFTREPEALDRDTLRKFILSDHDVKKYGQIRYVVLWEAERAGLIDLYDADIDAGTAWIGIIVHPDFRRKGVALNAVETLKRVAIESGIKVLLAEVNNTVSARLFESAGFERLGNVYRCDSVV